MSQFAAGNIGRSFRDLFERELGQADSDSKEQASRARRRAFEDTLATGAQFAREVNIGGGRGGRTESSGFAAATGGRGRQFLQTGEALPENQQRAQQRDAIMQLEKRGDISLSERVQALEALERGEDPIAALKQSRQEQQQQPQTGQGQQQDEGELSRRERGLLSDLESAAEDETRDRRQAIERSNRERREFASQRREAGQERLEQAAEENRALISEANESAQQLNQAANQAITEFNQRFDETLGELDQVQRGRANDSIRGAAESVQSQLNQIESDPLLSSAQKAQLKTRLSQQVGQRTESTLSQLEGRFDELRSQTRTQLSQIGAQVRSQANQLRSQAEQIQQRAQIQSQANAAAAAQFAAEGMQFSAQLMAQPDNVFSEFDSLINLELSKRGLGLVPDNGGVA